MIKLLIVSLVLIPGQHSLRINEIVSSPVGDEKDWIEFYNEAEVEINVEGYSFYDDKKAEAQTFSVNIFPPKTYRIVYPSDATVNPFGLGKGDELHLLDASGNEIHSTKWKTGDAPEGYSWSYCDNVFVATSVITKNANNSCPTSSPVCPKDGTVEISEIKTKNLTGSFDSPDYDWIELRNPSSSKVANLSCWTISDSTTGYVSRFQIPFDTLVQPNEYLVIDLLGKVSLGSSDEVRLYNGELDEEEKVTWKAYQNIDDSISRCISELDGSIEWQATALSKGAKNLCSNNRESLFEISEVYAANDTEWVEFYNSGDILKDASLWRFSDEWKGGNRLPGEQQRIDIGIKGKAYASVEVGKKFSFSSTGADGCRLYNPRGVLVAYTSWPATESPLPGTSWSKCPDGYYNVTETPTRDKANICGGQSSGSGSIMKNGISIFYFVALLITIL